MWISIDQDPPQETEMLLWLGAEPGGDKPIGQVVASYKNTAMGQTWVEKSVSGNINTGLRASLITHYKLLEDGPNGERTAPREDEAIGPLSFMG